MLRSHLTMVHDAVRRWRIRWRPATRRGQYGSTSELRQMRIHALKVEAYLLNVNHQVGVGASVYIGKEELLRLDCLGATGHYHINLRQSLWAAAGRVPRIGFNTSDVPGQALEAAVCIRRNLRNAIDTNWRPAVRATSVTDADIEKVAEAVASALGELIAAHQRQTRAHARASQ